MPAAFAEHVRAEIRAELARQNITRSQLAQQIGLDDQALYRRLQGRQPISLEDVEAIAGALGVPVSRFTDTAGVP